MKIVWLLLCSLSIIACNDIREEKDYTNFKSIGNTKFRVIIDGITQKESEVANIFSMNLINTNDTFLIKPNQSTIRFPELASPLKKATIKYGNFHFSAHGELIESEYSCFYFPESDSATLIIDHYPFTEPGAIQWKYLTKNETYFEINSSCHFRGRID